MSALQEMEIVCQSVGECKQNIYCNDDCSMTLDCLFLLMGSSYIYDSVFGI